MKRLKTILISSLLTLMLGLAITMAVLAISEMAPVEADVSNQPIIINVENDEPEYLPLTDAPPQRDISKQRFAPLEETQ